MRTWPDEVCTRQPDCHTASHYGDCKSMPYEPLNKDERAAVRMATKAAGKSLHVHRNRVTDLLAIIDRLTQGARYR